MLLRLVTGCHACLEVDGKAALSIPYDDVWAKTRTSDRLFLNWYGTAILSINFKFDFKLVLSGFFWQNLSFGCRFVLKSCRVASRACLELKCHVVVRHREQLPILSINFKFDSRSVTSSPVIDVGPCAFEKGGLTCETTLPWNTHGVHTRRLYLCLSVRIARFVGLR